VLVTAVAGCGSGSTQTPGSAAGAPSVASSGLGGRGTGRFPGTSGLIAEISGTTMQVQDGSRQTAVTWTAKTAMSKRVPASAKDVVPGVCVLVRTSAGQGSASGPVAATSIEVTRVVSGRCSLGNGFGGPPAGRPSDTQGSMPRPTGAVPSGEAASGAARPGRDGVRGVGLLGTVVSVGTGTLTVAPTSQSAGSSSGAASARTAPVEVSTSASTTYSRSASATAKDIAVGGCVTASGTPDDTGAVTATSLSLSAATDGTCPGGSRFRGQGSAMPAAGNG
jgi:hypothetical protein